MKFQTKIKNYCGACGAGCQPILTDLYDDRFGAPGIFDIVKCTECGLEQTAPQPTGDQLKKLYERFYNFEGESDTFYTRVREWFLSSSLYKLWLQLDGDISFHLRQGKRKLLDIGCNEGRTLSQYARNGFQAEGLELNEVAAAAARRRGFKVFTETLEKFKPEEGYDIVVLSNVLEHAINPLDMLRHVRRLLRPGGQVWISCPNAASYWRHFFGRCWINWHVPFHLWHFTPTTLINLLKQVKFSVQEISTSTPALWLAQSCCSSVTSKASKANRLLRSAPVIAGLMIILRSLLWPWLRQYDREMRGDCLIVVALVTPKKNA
jgi:2-polyprenyl-3-methyl-5-hydroxy-6-metoxy-1,4-benzoquinol methylase